MVLPANIRVNAQLPFPSLVTGTGPITITKANGVWTVGFSIVPFGVANPPVGNYPTDYLLGYDSVAKAYFQISLTNLLNGANPPQGVALLKGVNFNSANTDFAIPVTNIPPNAVGYVIDSIRIGNASQTLTTATFGVFTAPAAGGTAIVNAGTAITVAAAAPGTNNNTQSVTPNNSATLAYPVTDTMIYFRVGAAQGAAATGDVMAFIRWIY